MSVRTKQETLINWVIKAYDEHRQWRLDSFEDYAFRDGVHWSPEAYQALIDKGVTPLVINRIFPQINLVYGYYVNNQRDIVAKGRTFDDVELSQIMSEAIAHVMDQYDGKALQQDAFLDQIITGIGYLGIDYNSDPREETVEVYSLPWQTVWWDPAVPPKFKPELCKYVFTADWKDLSDVQRLFPHKAQELEELAGQYYANEYITNALDVGDPAVFIEDERLRNTHLWYGNDNRVRPVEMWFPEYERSDFLVQPDGHVIDLRGRDDLQLPADAHIVVADVPRMKHVIFIDQIELLSEDTPFSHDKYPVVPYVCYLDRFGRPFGIPRMLKEQNMEVNKRRSMALSLVNNRRVFIEEGAATDNMTAYREANRADGFVQLKNGRLNSIRVEELANLAKPQIDLMHISEKEIQDIAGTNQEVMGSDPTGQSKEALELRQHFSLVKLASVFENANLAQKQLGILLVAGIQDTWVTEKVLRLTDSLTGLERYVRINQQTENGYLNDITQVKHDVVVASKPITDTLREKNLELLFAAINSSPKEVVPSLLAIAFELSDLPNKNALLDQVRQALNVPEVNMSLSPRERAQLLLEKQQAAQAEQAEEKQRLNDLHALEVAEKQASIQKIQADTRAIGAATQKTVTEAENSMRMAAEEKATRLLDLAYGEYDA